MTASRPEICRRLVELQRKVEPHLLEIEQLKEHLREDVIASGEGFEEQVDGKGSVEAKAGCEPKFRGRAPFLKIREYLGLSDARRKKHDEIVGWEDNWSSARKPSITVRL